MKSDIEEVKKIIRSLLLSARHGLTVNELCAEYTAVTYKTLPYKEFGYNSAVDMVKDMPKVVRPVFYGSAMILKGIADESTAHINELVRHQKSTKRNPKIKLSQDIKAPVKTNIPSFIQKRLVEIIAEYPEGLLLSTLANNYAKWYGSTLDPKRLGFTSVSEIVVNCTDILQVKRMAGIQEIMVLPVKGLLPSPPVARRNHGDQIKTTVKKKVDPDSLFKQKSSIPTKIQDEIFAVLSEKPNGIWSARFPFEFKEYHNKELDYQTLGFNSIVELMSNIKERVTIERPVSNGDWILRPNLGEELPHDAVIDEHSKYSLQSPGELHQLIEIYLSYIINPTTFWFQCVSSLKHLNDLMERISTFYHNEAASHKYQLADEHIRNGQVCCALYEDEEWYRVIISDVISKQNIQVFYVDYGNEASVASTSLRLMKKEFLSLPSQALRGKLHNLKPNREKWSKESISRFFELTNDRHLYAKLVIFNKISATKCPLKESMVTSVNLINTCAEEDVIVNSVLVNEHHALPSVSTPTYGGHKINTENLNSENHKNIESEKLERGSMEEKTLHNFYENYLKTLQQVSLLHQQKPQQQQQHSVNDLSNPLNQTLEKHQVQHSKEISQQEIIPDKQKNIAIKLVEDEKPSLIEDQEKSLANDEKLQERQCCRTNDEPQRYHSLDKSVILKYQVPNNMSDDISCTSMEHKLINMTVNEKSKDTNMKSQRIEDTNNVVKMLCLSPTINIHFIHYNNDAYVTSGEISSLFWLADILRQMLRRINVSLPNTILLREDHPDLFQMLQSFDIKGLKSGVGSMKPGVTLYNFQSVMEICTHFKFKSEELKTKLEKEFEEYKTLSLVDYFYSNQQSKEDEIEKLKLQFQALSFKKKRLYLSVMMNRASKNAIDQIQSLDEQIKLLEDQMKLLH